MRIQPTFIIGLIAGGIVGFVLGLLVGILSKPAERKAARKESKAEKLFNLAMQQENEKRKINILGRIVERYPSSIWADKALEEVMKLKKEK